MSKAAELSAKLSALQAADGMNILESQYEAALFFDVIGDAMCIMHDDGSVNIIEPMGNGRLTVEAISPENILKVLHHYRPFTEVFKNQQIQ